MRKRILSLALVGIFSLVFSTNAMATSTVEFKGGAENFVFSSDDDWTGTDLFGGLKGMMPGDTRSEEITIRNNASDYDFVIIYLRAESNSEINALLSKLTLNVYRDGELISTSSASEQGGLATDVMIGAYDYGDESQLTAEVLIPATLGNDYMYTEGEIKWVFTAEAYVDGEIANVPDTGAMDTSNTGGASTEILIVGIIAVVIAVSGLTWLTLRKRA